MSLIHVVTEKSQESAMHVFMRRVIEVLMRLKADALRRAEAVKHLVDVVRSGDHRIGMRWWQVLILAYFLLLAWYMLLAFLLTLSSAAWYVLAVLVGMYVLLIAGAGWIGDKIAIISKKQKRAYDSYR